MHTNHCTAVNVYKRAWTTGAIGFLAVCVISGLGVAAGTWLVNWPDYSWAWKLGGTVLSVLVVGFGVAGAVFGLKRETEYSLMHIDVTHTLSSDDTDQCYDYETTDRQLINPA